MVSRFPLGPSHVHELRIFNTLNTSRTVPMTMEALRWYISRLSP